MTLLDPAEAIPYVVRMISGALTHEVENALRPARLTQIQLSALVQLGIRGALSTAELSRRCGVTPQSMATALADLQQRELITRRPHPTHGRMIEVSITDDGKALALRAQRLTAGVNAKALALFEPEDRRHLHRVLLTLADGLGVPIDRGHPSHDDMSQR